MSDTADRALIAAEIRRFIADVTLEGYYTKGELIVILNALIQSK